MGTERLRELPMPVIQTVYFPEGTVAEAVIETVAEPEPPDESINHAGLNVAFQPMGTKALKLTEPLNPLRDVTVAGRLAEDAGVMVSVEGETVREKSFVGVGTGCDATFTVMVAE